MPKHPRTLLTLLVACSLEPAMRDLLQVPDPQVRSSSTCNAWNDILFAPEGGEGGGGGGGGGGSGDEKKFTQADVDKIVKDRVKGLNDKVTALEATAGRITEIEAKLAEAAAREQAAREEAELKGKSELDQLKIQLGKANDKIKSTETEWKQKYEQAEAGAQQAQQKFVAHVQRGAVGDALNAVGLAKTALKHAPGAFLSEAQVELDEQHAIKSVTYNGETFSKVGDAAAAFLKDNPHFAAPSDGGSGTPRGNHGAGGAAGNSLIGLLSQSPDGRA